MIERPILKPIYHPEPLDDGRVLLLCEAGHQLLEGSLYGDLISLLNGRHTPDQIVDLLSDKAEAAEVYYAIMLMEREGFLEELRTDSTRDARIWWSHQGIDGDALKATEPCVSLHGSLGRDEVARALEEAGIKIDNSANFGLLLVDDYLAPEMKATFTTPWLPLKCQGSQIWLGPVFGKTQSACPHCLIQRIEAHRPAESWLEQRYSKEGLPRRVSAPAGYSKLCFNLAAQFAALELCRYLHGDTNHPLDNHILSYEPATREITLHRVVRLPHCACCGDSQSHGSVTAQAPLLQSRPKRYLGACGQRTTSPSETYARLAHHVSPICGAVRELRPLRYPNQSLMYGYSAGPNLAFSGRSFVELQDHLRATNGGKGKTPEEAKVSALCEALERCCGEYRGYEPVLRSSYAALGQAAIHPDRLQHFSAAQFAARQSSNRQTGVFGHIPQPFDTEAQIGWSPVWSLTHRTTRYLPTAYAFYHAPPEPAGTFCIPNSNGCASGNTLEEAMVHGLLEVIERDAVAIWWYNRLQQPEVDLDAFEDPYPRLLRQQYALWGRKMWVLDLTGDLGIPTMVAINAAAEGDPWEPLFGFGAHTDPCVALNRALTEMNQFMFFLDVTQKEPEQRYTTSNTEVIHWLRHANPNEQAYLLPSRSEPPRRPEYYQLPRHDDLLDELYWLVKHLADAGLETLMLDQSRPEVEIPVVKMIVPEMRMYWRRLAPGRLYDVPVGLGRLPRARSEGELNPIDLFL